MHIAIFLRAWLAGQYAHQRSLALRQPVERRDDVFERVEVIHPLRATAEFAGSLRTAEQQHTHDGDFAAVEVEDLLQAVLVFRDAAVGAARGAGHALLLQGHQRFADSAFVQRHHRVAVVLLVAGVDQSIERQRVVIGRGDVFFDQGAQDAGFDFSKNVHGGGLILLEKDELTTEVTEELGGSQNPHPVARCATRMGHPRVQARTVQSRDVSTTSPFPEKFFPCLLRRLRPA